MSKRYQNNQYVISDTFINLNNSVVLLLYTSGRSAPGHQNEFNYIHKSIMIFIILISLSKQKRRCSGCDLFPPRSLQNNVLVVQKFKIFLGENPQTTVRATAKPFTPLCSPSGSDNQKNCDFPI